MFGRGRKGKKGSAASRGILSPPWWKEAKAETEPGEIAEMAKTFSDALYAFLGETPESEEDRDTRVQRREYTPGQLLVAARQAIRGIGDRVEALRRVEAQIQTETRIIESEDLMATSDASTEYLNRMQECIETARTNRNALQVCRDELIREMEYEAARQSRMRLSMQNQAQAQAQANMQDASFAGMGQATQRAINQIQNTANDYGQVTRLGQQRGLAGGIAPSPEYISQVQNRLFGAPTQPTPVPTKPAATAEVVTTAPRRIILEDD